LVHSASMDKDDCPFQQQEAGLWSPAHNLNRDVSSGHPFSNLY
jgi:hypothetical protein